MDSPSLVKHRRFERNLVLYPWYAASFNAFFWMPVFFLYFSERFPLEAVLQLEAIYYAAVVLLEVPSGYFSDFYGRKKTLLISSSALVLAYALFLAGRGFVTFAAAQFALAVGISFNSGTDASFHFDSLAALGQEKEFEEREATVARNAFLAGGLAALLGGASAVFDLRYAYALSSLAGLLTLGIATATTEPTVHQRRATISSGFLLQLKQCLSYLKNSSLLWLFGFYVLMTVLNHVPYEFYQPYIRLLVSNLSSIPASTPFMTGVHMALTMLLGSCFAAYSAIWRQKVGLGPALLSSTLLQTIIIGMMGLMLHPLVVVLILLRSSPRALMTAPLNAAVAPRVPQSQRATYLSLQSLVGRLAFSGFLLVLSWAAGTEAPTDWTTVSLLLRIGLIAGVFGLVTLAATLRVAFRHDRK